MGIKLLGWIIVEAFNVLFSNERLLSTARSWHSRWTFWAWSIFLNLDINLGKIIKSWEASQKDSKVTIDTSWIKWGWERLSFINLVKNTDSGVLVLCRLCLALALAFLLLHRWCLIKQGNRKKERFKRHGLWPLRRRQCLINEQCRRRRQKFFTRFQGGRKYLRRYLQYVGRIMTLQRNLSNISVSCKSAGR